MSEPFHFTFEAEWRTCPVAYWVHLPLPGAPGRFDPPAPAPLPHRGYAVLHVGFEAVDLVFSALPQLDHVIAVLATKPLPTSRQLSARRGSGAGPNGHWLSRLPARLKAPRRREQLLLVLRAARTAVAAGTHAAFRAPLPA